MSTTPATYPGHRIATPHRDENLLIRPSFVDGTFDSHAVDCPFVFSVDGRQGMTYVGWDGTGYQSALTWNDGERWTPGAVVFPRDPNSAVRQNNSALTSIVRDNDLGSAGELKRFGEWYYATYHAYPAAGYEAGPGSIGIARSRDLTSWEEYGGVLRPAEGGPWEQGGLYKSWLLEHDGLFYVYYNAKDRDHFGTTAVPPPWTEQTGLAVSRDLVTWERWRHNPVLAAGAPGDFDERFASDPCVLRDGDFWIMFYFGLAEDGHAREGYATSRNLRDWQKSREILMDVGPPGSIDSTHTHKPAVITWNGRLEHYYCAVGPQEPVRIGGYAQAELRGIARAVGEQG
jgi:predicted GH43/DUF377 family glycosyl hydrolase